MRGAFETPLPLVESELRRTFDAVASSSPEQRDEALNGACGADLDLRQEVEVMPPAHDGAPGSFLAHRGASGRRSESPANTRDLTAGDSSAARTALLTPGDRIAGRFVIVRFLARGGMGEVYEAQDGILGGAVALKVIRPELSSKPISVERFKRETALARRVTHPNVCRVFDLYRHGPDGNGEGPSSLVISMEMLSGETLAERISRAGPLSTVESLAIARQVAWALDAAHRAGVIHRDLKSSNIFLVPDAQELHGRAVVTDFGMARSGVSEGQGSDSLTQTGAFIGTPCYAAPELLRGQDVDARADLFSLGAVMLEMLTGAVTFRRNSVAETVTAVLSEDPAPVNPSSPAPVLALEQVARHCLEKNPADRYSSARDALFDLELLSGVAAGALPRPVAARSRQWPILLLLAGLVLGWLVATLGRPRADEEAAPVSIGYLTNSGHDVHPSLSPDGRLVAFVSDRDGVRRVWVKDIAGGEEIALTSGVDAFPRFSPDGLWILFARQAGTRWDIYKVPAMGGEARRIVADAIEGDWAPDGRRIAFTYPVVPGGATISYGLAIAAADGSVRRSISELGARARASSPRWSPDGRSLAIAVEEVEMSGGRVSLRYYDLEGHLTGQSPDLEGQSAIESIAWSGGSATLVHARAQTIIDAVGFNTSSRIVAQDVHSATTRTLFWVPSRVRWLDVGRGGEIIMGTEETRENLREITIVDGRPETRWLTHGRSNDRQPVYSPDAESVVFASDRSGNSDLWAVSLRSGVLRRLTDDPGEDWDPGFVPATGQLIWSSSRSGHFEIWIAETDGSGARQLSDDGADAENPTATPDGQWIVYNSAHPQRAGIWKVRPDGTDATRILADVTVHPEVSPDGRWVLYQTDTRLGVVSLEGEVEPFSVTCTDLPDLLLISICRARWRPDGRAIVYVDHDPSGRTGLFEEDFTPGEPNHGPRRTVLPPRADSFVETFGLSPEGGRVTVADLNIARELLIARGAGHQRP